MLIAVDLGTSWIKALVVDPISGAVHGRDGRSMAAAQVDGLPAGWSEQDPMWVVAQTEALLEQLLDAVSPATTVSAIACTAQMHGVLLVSPEGEALTHLIDWRDRRALEPCPGTGDTWLAALLDGSAEAWPAERTGCFPACGYGATTLYWLARTGNLPDVPGATFCTLADFVVSRLGSIEPVTDPSLAASTALFDVRRGVFLESALDRLGAASLEAPRCIPGGTPVATWRGIPLLAPTGDAATASFAVLAGEDDAQLNYGTGSQIIAPTARMVDCHRESAPRRRGDGLETRPAVDGGLLAVAAGSVGGQTLQTWRQMIQRCRSATDGPATMTELFDLAREVPYDCDGLRMDPRIFGTRTRPDLAAELAGIRPDNWRRGHLFRACLEGMARVWRDSLLEIEDRTEQAIECLALTGRLFAEQPFVTELVADTLEVETRVVTGSDASAVGAARLARMRSERKGDR